MKKKIIIFALLCCMLLSGCQNTNDTQNGDSNMNQNQNAANDENNNKNTTPAQENGDTVDNTGNRFEESSNGNDSQEYTVEDVKITDPNEALNRLKEGNQRFMNDDSAMINVTSQRRDDLLEGQTPYAVVLSCSDSRVTPNIIFNVGLGEIFDVRLAGNVLNEEALGSIEYGVEHLHAPLIVVMGHESCGAVTAAYDYAQNGTEAEGNINSLVENIHPAIKDSEDLDGAIHANIDYVTEELLKDEIVKHLVDEGKVEVVKAYYALNGEVTFQE